MGWGMERVGGSLTGHSLAQALPGAKGESFWLSQESWGVGIVSPPIPTLFKVVHIMSRMLRKSVSIQDSCFEVRSFTHEQNRAPEMSLGWALSWFERQLSAKEGKSLS